MGIAIGWFALAGYTVCIPLTDSQPFDLVVERDEGLQKVFVRTTTKINKYGRYEVGLRTTGGNKSQVKVRMFDASSVDLAFIACGDGSNYLIPSSAILCVNSLTLGSKYQDFRLVPT